MMLGQLDTHMQENVDTYLTTYTKMSSKWINTLNVTDKIIQLRRKHQNKSYDLGSVNSFLHMIPKHRQQKKKIGKSDFMKIKNFSNSN